MKILAEQVACRGFDHGLTAAWIYLSITLSIREGKVQAPLRPAGHGGECVAVFFSVGTIKSWKYQYLNDNGIRPPRYLWPEIDEILGVQDPSACDEKRIQHRPLPALRRAG